jgi:hypothetical protein
LSNLRKLDLRWNPLAIFNGIQQLLERGCVIYT